MKVHIWKDESNHNCNHNCVSLDDIEISNFVTGLGLRILPGHPPKVDLELLPSQVEVEVEAKVELIIDGNRFHLKEITKKEQ